jgi:hypothetical protein
MHEPKAIICGMLEKDGKILFLEKDGKIELPWVYGSLRGDPISQMAEAYLKKTDVKVEAGLVVMEGKSEGLTVVVLQMEPQAEVNPEPAAGYSVAWLTLEEAKKKPLARHFEWIGSL